MGAYVIRRCLAGIVAILMTVMLVFFLLRILPGDVAYQMLLRPWEGAAGFGSGIDPTALDTLRKELGLDKPLHVQFVEFVWNTARGDFGKSLYSGNSVWTEIRARLPMTLQIALTAQFIAISLGIPIGIITAIKQDSWPDYLLRVWTIFFLAIPGFWIGIMILLGGLMFFEWSPPVGRNVLWESPLDSFRQTIWPALVLASHSTAILARYTRSSMLEVLREDYIRTARAKGLKEQVVVVRHAMRNALIPVVTVIGLSFGTLVAGTVILERVFTIPGVGNLFLNSITTRDYPVVQAIVFLVACTFVVTNIVVDFLYGWLDPRISLA